MGINSEKFVEINSRVGGGPAIAGSENGEVLCPIVDGELLDTLAQPNKNFAIGDGPGTFIEGVFSPRIVQGCNVNANTIADQAMRLAGQPPGTWDPSGPWIINFLSIDSGNIESINVYWFARFDGFDPWELVGTREDFKEGESYSFDVVSHFALTGDLSYEAVFTGFKPSDDGGFNLSMNY